MKAQPNTAGRSERRTLPTSLATSTDTPGITGLIPYDTENVIGRGTWRAHSRGEPRRRWALQATLCRRDSVTDLPGSFCFEAADESWAEPRSDSELPLRELRTIARLHDVSPVAFAAYPTATAGLRSARDAYERGVGEARRIAARRHAWAKAWLSTKSTPA